MSYRVRLDSFEGPFDLLLYLVSSRRVDIASISVSEIVDQYLAYVERLEELDLEVASDFLLVASTLLNIKAASLLPSNEGRDDVDDDLEDLSPSEARDLLIERLISYKTYKNASVALSRRFEAQGRIHPRTAGPDPEFLGLMPDFLRDVGLDELAVLCATSMARREIVLLESEHIAARPVPLEPRIRAFHRRMSLEKHLRFSDLIADAPSLPVRVVSFLAILELYKQNMVRLMQDEPLGDIAVDFVEDSGALVLDGLDEEGGERA